MASYWVNNKIITELADLDDFPNYTEIKNTLGIVLFCNKNKTKTWAIGINSQFKLDKMEMAFYWQSQTCTTAPLGCGFS